VTTQDIGFNNNNIETMKEKDIKEIWGNELYKVFKQHIDEEGWLTSQWADIIEDEIPKYDEDYNKNVLFESTYQRMYYLDMEHNFDYTKVRPLPNQN